MPITQTSSIAHLASDPLRNFKFQVTIRPNSGGAINLGFMSVSGLNITVDVIAYRVGSYNTTTQKMPGQADFSPITLSRGLAVGTPQNWQWMKELFTVMQGTGTSNGTTDFRAMIDVQVLAHPVTAATVNYPAWFRIYNAWPTALAYSDLDAGANQLLIEQMTLAHEGFDFELATGLGQDSAAPVS
jgi:phage tail-like protein